MSKLSFRARALDATKPMQVFKTQDIPDLPEFTAINRAVQQLPTGMEKEEETEHHLQRALSAQQAFGTAETLVIPVPDIEKVGDRYRRLYGTEQAYKPPKQYVHVQPWGMDQEIPDYDMDSEDEHWLDKQAKKMEVTPIKFENMLDRLEKGSGQTVVTLPEAKALLKEDDDLTIAVYDYWLNKRLRLQHALIPTVKTEKRDGSTTNNPYVAFRRRTEKMQTRKNRKNDEASYEKMLKLRRDLNRALTILEMMKRREKSKKELLQLTIEVVDKRQQMQDWDGKALADAMALRHKLPAFIPLGTAYPSNWPHREGAYVRKPKREYKKRKHKQPAYATPTSATAAPPSALLPHYGDAGGMRNVDVYSSDDDARSMQPSASDHEVDEETDNPDGVYVFRRKAGCLYHAPLEAGLAGWPWCGRDDGGLAEKKYRFSLASLGAPRPHCVAFVRRRVGRGGRILLDRAHTDWDDYLEQLDLRAEHPDPGAGHPAPGWEAEYTAYIKSNKFLHFRPRPAARARSDSSGDEACPSSLFSPRPVDRTPPFCLPGAGPGPGAGAGTAEATSHADEFNFESHREALLAMQRAQRTRLLQATDLELRAAAADLDPRVAGVATDASLAGGASRVTLDSASAHFAASAVRTQVTPGAAAAALRPPPGAAPDGGGARLANGPTASSCDAHVSGLSTSPAANVLQLNFPLASPSPSPLGDPSSTAAVDATDSERAATPRHALFPPVSVLTSPPPSSSSRQPSVVLKLEPTNKNDSLTSENVDVSGLGVEKSVAMQVT